MATYSKIEKGLARLLNAAPSLKQGIKKAYSQVNYFLHKEREFSNSLHPEAMLITPSAWVSQPDAPSVPRFFGYYDVSPWSPDMSCLVLHRPVSKEEVAVELFDRNSALVRTLTASRAYTYQQGSRTQWLPGNGRRVITNNFRAGALVSEIHDVEKGTVDVLPMAVQAVDPSGTHLVSINYFRLSDLHSDYGYNRALLKTDSIVPFEEDGIWKTDLSYKEPHLLVSLQQLRSFQPRAGMATDKHKVNHVAFSPSGSSIAFIHRWLAPSGRLSRLFVCTRDGRELKLLLDDDMVSHYTWKSEDELVVWARTSRHGDRYYLIDTQSTTVTPFGSDALSSIGDGHPSFSPDGNWLVTDSYPNRKGQRHLVLYRPSDAKLIQLGRFNSPPRFTGYSRCDLHPRWSPDGQYVSIDSTHEGQRQSYLIQVGDVINA